MRHVTFSCALFPKPQTKDSLQHIMTSSSVYCFVSGGGIHCVPVNSFNEYSNSVAGPAPNVELPASPTKHGTYLSPTDAPKIKNRNLLYTLNNPSLSDVESDSGDVNEDGDYISGVLNNYSAHALYFPAYFVDLPDNLTDNYTQIKQFLQKVFFRTWTDEKQVHVKRLTGGITNMLLQCTYQPLGESVLMRVYGPGTNLIIDRHREFISHLVLNSMKLAPPVHARFKNGLVYGFLEGRSLEPAELRLKSLYPLIAQQLGNWHAKVNIEEVHKGVNKLREYTRSAKRQSLDQPRDDVSETRTDDVKKEKKKKRSISNIWQLIEDWINIVPTIPQLVDSFKENSDQAASEHNIRDLVLKEFEWAKDFITSHIDSPVVSSHCDLLSGNIIIPDESLLTQELTSLPALEDNPIKFIDYEYMLPAPRGFDIANHLAEWQGFDCDRSAIPEPSEDNDVLVEWVTAYLNGQEGDVKGVIEEIRGYYGLPGFYWGVWAAIQSELSNIDFDYANYTKLRFQEYWDWKKKFT